MNMGNPAAAPVYLWDRREFSFLLWEFFNLEQQFLGQGVFARVNRADVEALLERAGGHAAQLASAFSSGDRDRARLGEDGRVHIPDAFSALWPAHKRDWFWLRQHVDSTRQDEAGEMRYPGLVNQLVMELFSGANPAFMTYGAFSASAANVIRYRGTSLQKEVFLEKLDSVEWDACFCATEVQAGSDVMAVQTTARHLEGEIYAVSGEKRYITAGMHELTDNTVYLVLGRIQNNNSAKLSSLSCFLVPRYWPQADGTLVENHVACTHVEDKMGLNGCANTRLKFGSGGDSRGYLLGNMANVALMQLSVLMRTARIGTGLISVSMASSAYLHALGYARGRVQGTAFDKAAELRAPKVPIIEHRDVQRMLLEMKAKVEGCRLLVARISLHATCIQQLYYDSDSKGRPLDEKTIQRHAQLALLYAPVAKAYLSDEAWNITTTAVQVHGAVGYFRDLPLEQYLRDLKVLTIWEGTNFIQSQDLVRDKLQFGRDTLVMKAFEVEIGRFFEACAQVAALAPERALLQGALVALRAALGHIARHVDAGEKLLVSQFTTRYLAMFGDVLVGWNLLEAAHVSLRGLDRPDVSTDDQAFYRGKVASAKFFCYNVLPRVQAGADLFANAAQAYVALPAADFGFAS